MKKIIYILLLFAVSSVFGLEPIIKDIGVYENRHFSDGEIKDLMKTKKSPRIRLWGKPKRLNLPLLELDLAQIKGYYIGHGFLNVEVASNIVENDDNSVFVNIFVYEGAKFYVRNISITGDSLPEFKKIIPQFNLEESKSFAPGDMNTDGKLFSNKAKNLGYPYVKVKSEWTKMNMMSLISEKDTFLVDSVDINHDIKLGKKAYIGKVSYKNLKYAKEFILRRELRLKKGEKYSQENLLKSKEDLYQTGLFSIVRINPEDSDEQPDTMDFTVSVFEKDPKWIGLKTGLIIDPTYDMTTDATLEWGNRNIMGTGRTVIARAISSFELINRWDNLSNRFEIDYTEPWSFAKRLPITLNLYYEPNNSSLTERYSTTSYGAMLYAKYRFKRNRQHILSISYDNIDKYDIQDVDSTEAESDVVENTIERKINYSFERDSRDNILFPTDGTVFIFQNEFAGWLLGGDEHYEKFELTWNRYQLLKKKYVYAFRFKSGYILPLKEGDYKVQEHNRFYLGGSNTIRGVKERDLGPTYLNSDGVKEPDGGYFYLLSSFELRFPIAWRFHGQVFSDMGNLWSDFENYKTKDIMVTTGWGISLVTPFGPIRFDYGFQVVNPLPDYNKSWHLSILYAF